MYFEQRVFPNNIQAYSYLVAGTSTFASWSSKKKQEKNREIKLIFQKTRTGWSAQRGSGGGKAGLENISLIELFPGYNLFYIYDSKVQEALWLKWSKLHTFQSINSQSFYLVAQLDSNHISSNKEIYHSIVFQLIQLFQVTRVSTQGSVTVTLNVITKDLARYSGGFCILYLYLHLYLSSPRILPGIQSDFVWVILIEIISSLFSGLDMKHQTCEFQKKRFALCSMFPVLWN